MLTGPAAGGGLGVTGGVLGRFVAVGAGVGEPAADFEGVGGGSPAGLVSLHPTSPHNSSSTPSLTIRR